MTNNSDTDTSPKIIGNSPVPREGNPQAEAAMKNHLAAIRRTIIDPRYAYDPEGLVSTKIAWMAQHCQRALDVGQS